MSAKPKSKSPPTPGPWYVGDDRAADCPDHHNSGLALVDTGRESDWPIARLVEWNNAHLIAAAPDLLAAIKELRPYFEGEHAHDHPHCIQMRAAIAKAEGRLP